MQVTRVGVTMRAQALAIAAASRAGKRRKLRNGESKFSPSSAQFNSRRGRRGRREKQSPERSITPAPPEDVGRVADRSRSPSSCCSSNASLSSEFSKKKLKITDLEDENKTCKLNCKELNHSSSLPLLSLHMSLHQRSRKLFTREMPPLSEQQAESGELEPTERRPETKYPVRSRTEKMPSEAELEEFFTAVEEKIQKQFAEKYNFDFAKDLPFEGVYEWVPVKP